MIDSRHHHHRSSGIQLPPTSLPIPIYIYVCVSVCGVRARVCAQSMFDRALNFTLSSMCHLY